MSSKVADFLDDMIVQACIYENHAPVLSWDEILQEFHKSSSGLDDGLGDHLDEITDDIKNTIIRSGFAILSKCDKPYILDDEKGLICTNKDYILQHHPSPKDIDESEHFRWLEYDYENLKER